MPQRDRQALEPSLLRQCAVRLAAAALSCGLATYPAAGFACGYHDPAAVSLGILNWIYPDSLHVRTAVWQAEDAGILPPRKARRGADLFAFHRTVSDMRALGARLTAAKPSGGNDHPFTVVLLDSVMWTRFAAAEGALAVEAHVNGPARGDVVVVTDGKVVRAMLAEVLGFAGAEAQGLLRLYGDAAGLEAVRARFGAFDHTPARMAEKLLEPSLVGSAPGESE
jgi:hypothetical protein